MNGSRLGNIAHMIRLPDMVTIANALLGFTAILMVAIGELSNAAILILVAALADGLDGALARRGEPSVFGLNLDSLADSISFGMAPAVMGYFLIGSFPIAFILPAMYLMCGILRLARFNVSRDDEFVGLPITAAGVCVALLALVAVDSLILVGAYMILSVLMVSRIGYPKVRNFKILIPVGIVVIIGIILGYIIGLGVVSCFSWPLLVIIGGYLISPLIKEVYHVFR
ncbi:MAG: CDP-diacylglycerol--serine O-phosphatidyltransferase [Methanosarcinales archaeon Met12]|nr:MAG: CDP-diacylglycerol--serine O-phosphatidyltransferase [Methanosarcinales archaeon Met12]